MTNGTHDGNGKAGRPPISELERGRIPEEEIEQLLAHLEEMPAKTAIRHSTISWGTFNTYLRKGAKETEGVHREFLYRTTRARAKYKAKLENQAAMKRPEWMLAMLYPKEYSLKQQIEHEGSISVASYFRGLEAKDPILDRA